MKDKSESIIVVEANGQGLKIGSNMSKREFYAAFAILGFLAKDLKECQENIAKYSVNMADALIKKLDK